MILLVDADRDLTRFIETHLRVEGHEVAAATDGVTALQMASERRPDLIILEATLPRMDGYGLCAELRADPRTARTGIIMLTAKSLSADKLLGFSAGADDYVTKPFDPMELAARVNALLRRARQ